MDTNIFSDVWQRCQTGGRVGGGARGGTPSSRLFPPFTQFLCAPSTKKERRKTKKKDGHVIGYLADDQYFSKFSNAWFINRSRG